MQTVLHPQSALRELRLIFAVPPQQYAWRVKPLVFIKYLLKLHSPNALSSKLKRLGLITAVSVEETSPQYCTLLEVTDIKHTPSSTSSR